MEPITFATFEEARDWAGANLRGFSAWRVEPIDWTEHSDDSGDDRWAVRLRPAGPWATTLTLLEQQKRDLPR